MSLGNFNFSSSGRSATLPERINNVVRYSADFNATSRNNGVHSYMDEDAGQLYLLSGTTFRKIVLDTNGINTLVTLAGAPTTMFMFSGISKNKGYFYAVGSNRTIYRYNIIANSWTTRATVGAHNIINGSGGYDMVDEIANDSLTDDCVYFKTWHISSTDVNRRFYTFSFYKYIVRLDAAILMFSIQEIAEGTTFSGCSDVRVQVEYFSNAMINVEGFTDNHIYFLNGVYELSYFFFQCGNPNRNNRTLSDYNSTSRKIHKELFTTSAVTYEKNIPSFYRRVGNLIYYYDNMNRQFRPWNDNFSGARNEFYEPANRSGNGSTIRIFDLNSNAWSSGGNSPTLAGRGLGGVYKNNIYSIGGAWKLSYFEYEFFLQFNANRSVQRVHEADNTILMTNLLQLS
jgi:hypothetical protein